MILSRLTAEESYNQTQVILNEACMDLHCGPVARKLVKGSGLLNDPACFGRPVMRFGLVCDES